MVSDHSKISVHLTPRRFEDQKPQLLSTGQRLEVRSEQSAKKIWIMLVGLRRFMQVPMICIRSLLSPLRINSREVFLNLTLEQRARKSLPNPLIKKHSLTHDQPLGKKSLNLPSEILLILRFHQ